MGKTSHAEPGPFATEVSAYLRHLLNANGREDLSGRWLETITHGARKRDYWAGIVKGVKEMTTNDIAVIAEAFGMASPFDYVQNAHTLAETGDAPVFDVAPHAEDYDISDDPEDYAKAAKRHPGA